MTDKIQVSVYLHSALRKKLAVDKSKIIVSLPEGSAIDDLIALLGIDFKTTRLLLAKNGEVADLYESLSTGDKIHLILPISGG